MIRKCKKCAYEGPVENFASAGTRNGKQYYRHSCKSCYSKEKYQDKLDKKSIFLEFKKQQICNRCGFNDYRALVFHHQDPTSKEIEVANAVRAGWSIERIMIEISKCEVLCANCHAIEHSTYRD